MSRINLNSPSLYQIMAGWDSGIKSDLVITRKVGNILIDALIPANVRTKDGSIPKRVDSLLSFVSEENKMKLQLMGVDVKYVYENISPIEYLAQKEVA